MLEGQGLANITKFSWLEEREIKSSHVPGPGGPLGLWNRGPGGP
jgi:hypothetical protein